MARAMPVQKPGRSVQEVGTPKEFLAAVQLRFGRIGLDLAANKDNAVCAVWFGPGHHLPGCEDSLSRNWSMYCGLLWLNPPYADIGKWAKKCASYDGTGTKIAMLIPAAIGTNYFREYIHGKALVLALSPRLTFVGHNTVYPKDLILAVYGVKPGFECWRWDGK